MSPLFVHLSMHAIKRAKSIEERREGKSTRSEKKNQRERTKRDREEAGGGGDSYRGASKKVGCWMVRIHVVNLSSSYSRNGTD